MSDTTASLDGDSNSPSLADAPVGGSGDSSPVQEDVDHTRAPSLVSDDEGDWISCEKRCLEDKEMRSKLDLDTDPQLSVPVNVNKVDPDPSVRPYCEEPLYEKPWWEPEYSNLYGVDCGPPRKRKASDPAGNCQKRWDALPR